MKLRLKTQLEDDYKILELREKTFESMPIFYGTLLDIDKDNGSFKILNEDELVQRLLTEDDCNIEDKEGADLKKSSNTISDSETEAMLLKCSEWFEQ